MKHRYELNDRWLFTETWDDALLRPEYAGKDAVSVRLPHTCKVTPYDYFSENTYQMLSGYRRLLNIPADWKGKRLLLTVEAAGH